MKKLLRNLFVFFMVFSLFIPSISNAYWNGNFHKQTDVIYYMAGVMSYSIWKHNDGTWQNGISPQSTNVNMNAEYSFTVPNRKIIGVTMERFNSNDSLHIAIWKDTRTERSSDLERKACYVKSVSSNPTWSGKNTSTAKVNCELTLDLTKNYIQTGVPSPKNERKEWQGENVEGFTYDVPVIFRIELEPISKQNITVMHIDQTTGQEIAPREYYKDLAPGIYYFDKKDIPGYIYSFREIEKPDGTIKRYRVEKMKVTITATGEVIEEPIVE